MSYNERDYKENQVSETEETFSKSLRNFKLKWLNREDYSDGNVSTSLKPHCKIDEQMPVYGTENSTSNENCDKTGIKDSPPAKGKRKSFFSLRQHKLEKVNSVSNPSLIFAGSGTGISLNSTNLLTEFDDFESNTSNVVDSQDVASPDIDSSPNAINLSSSKNFFLDSSKSYDYCSDSEGSSEIITAFHAKANLLENVSTHSESKVSNSIQTLNCPPSKIVSLFVGDLDKSISELELHNFFRVPGMISVKIPRDSISGQSLGYGYINFDSQKNADDALDKMNYLKLGESEIRIMPSLRDKFQRERTGANIFFSNLSSNLSTRIIYDRFKTYGKILSCKYSPDKKTCFINFLDKSDAYKVCQLFNKSEMDGFIICTSAHILKKDRINFQKNVIGSSRDSSIFKEEFISTADQKSVADEFKSAIKAKIESASILKPQINKISKIHELNHLNHNFKANNEVVKPTTIGRNTEKKLDTQFSLFLRNLPLQIHDNVIRGIVEPYGKVTSILSRKVPSKNGTWALVTLTSKDSIDRAIINLNAVEIEGHQLFVTRAIPREQKAYARKEEFKPLQKFKILISNVDLNSHRSKLEYLCNIYDNIKSIELYGATDIGNNSYGYVEMESSDDSNIEKLMDQLKGMGISCYKVKIEIPSKSFDFDFEAPKYPYILNERNHFLNSSTVSSPVSFSYVDPTKMFQIADLNLRVGSDNLRALNKKETHKKRYVYRNQEDERLKMKLLKINEIIWDIAIDLFSPESNKNKVRSISVMGTTSNDFLLKNRIESLTEHLLKFFWAKNVDELFNFLINNLCDQNGKVFATVHPIIKNQLIQSAMYLGIIPK